MNYQYIIYTNIIKRGELILDYRLRNLLENIIREYLNIGKGKKFKLNAPLGDLINTKVKNNEDRLKKYICIAKELEKKIGEILPFVDLSDLTLDWTTEQLFYSINESLKNIEPIKAKLHNYKDNTEVFNQIKNITFEVYGKKDNKILTDYFCNYLDKDQINILNEKLKPILKKDEFDIKYYSINQLIILYRGLNLLEEMPAENLDENLNDLDVGTK